MLRNISCYREINNAQKLYWWCQIEISCDVVGKSSLKGLNKLSLSGHNFCESSLLKIKNNSVKFLFNFCFQEL